MTARRPGPSCLQRSRRACQLPGLWFPDDISVDGHCDRITEIIAHSNIPEYKLQRHATENFQFGRELKNCEGGVMRRGVLRTFLILACVLADPGWSADLRWRGQIEPATPIFSYRTIFPACHYIWTCGPHGCGPVRVCPRGCPDRYSCYPLYGAYGPYGGVGYWAGFSP